MCVAHIDYACSLFNKCENGVLKMYVVFAILLIRFLKRHIAISKNKIFTIVKSRPFHYPAYIRNYKKRVLKRHIAISKNKSLLSFIPDRFAILHISVTYKMVGIRGGTLPQGRNSQRRLLMKIESSPSFNSDRFAILYISATYKKVGI